MNPKEKAIELFIKFYMANSIFAGRKRVKKQVLVCIAESIEQWEIYYIRNPEPMVKKNLIFWYDVMREVNKTTRWDF